MKLPELLLPAGNFEKMKAALRFGADAVYLSGQAFGMRQAADNFTVEELYAAIAYAHERNKKVYVTVNVMPHTSEYPALERYLSSLAGAKPDALIVADVGVLALAAKCLPDVALHISTQAGCVSHADCVFWQKWGASRVVLARELTLAEIAEIRAALDPAMELEAFIHGSMCVSFSGRCLLSNHFTGRDANRGQCAQPCRWHYRLYELEEGERPGERLPLYENDEGTFILSSKDLCMIEHIPDLVNAGLSSLKIEGRVKSACYAAVTANTYRIALDAYAADPAGYTYDPAWLCELESVNHREYATGFFYDTPQSKGQTVTRDGYLAEKAYLGTVLSYDGATGRATLLQRNKVAVGDRVELLTPGYLGRAFSVEALFDADGGVIEAAPHPKMIFSLPVPFPVGPGDMLRRA